MFIIKVYMLAVCTSELSSWTAQPSVDMLSCETAPSPPSLCEQCVPYLGSALPGPLPPLPGLGPRSQFSAAPRLGSPHTPLPRPSLPEPTIIFRLTTFEPLTANRLAPLLMKVSFREDYIGY